MLAILFALTAMPVLLSGLWLANRPRLPASRLLAVHVLLAGAVLLTAAVALHLSGSTARHATGIVIAAAVLVNALGVSAWLRLRAARTGIGTRRA